MRLTLKKKCPKCGSIEYVRIPRKAWMRLIKDSFLLECNMCRSEFLCVHDEADTFKPLFFEGSSAGLTSSRNAG